MHKVDNETNSTVWRENLVVRKFGEISTKLYTYLWRIAVWRVSHAIKFWTISVTCMYIILRMCSYDIR